MCWRKRHDATTETYPGAAWPQSDARWKTQSAYYDHRVSIESLVTVHERATGAGWKSAPQGIPTLWTMSKPR